MDVEIEVVTVSNVSVVDDTDVDKELDVPNDVEVDDVNVVAVVVGVVEFCVVAEVWVDVVDPEEDDVPEVDVVVKGIVVEATVDVVIKSSNLKIIL